MKRLSEWIKNHQIAAFFMITFAITWGLGFTYRAALVEGVLWPYPVASLATCGPALAGILITAISYPQPRQGSRKAPWIAFLVAWMVAELVWLAYLIFINKTSFSPGLAVFSLAVVAPVAFVISMAYARKPAIKSYVSSLLRLRGVWGWALLALALYPALILLLILAGHLPGRQPITNYPMPKLDLSLMGLVGLRFCYQFLFYNATGEETGWRGFAFPRLQARTSPLIASLIVAIFWIPWHFFLWQAEGAAVDSLSFWLNNGSFIVLSAIITGWFYNRSRGSILVAGVDHAAENTFARTFPFLEWFGYGYLVLKLVVVVVLILVERMWEKLPADHQAVFNG